MAFFYPTAEQLGAQIQVNGILVDVCFQNFHGLGLPSRCPYNKNNDIISASLRLRQSQVNGKRQMPEALVAATR